MLQNPPAVPGGYAAGDRDRRVCPEGCFQKLSAADQYAVYRTDPGQPALHPEGNEGGEDRLAGGTGLCAALCPGRVPEGDRSEQRDEDLPEHRDDPAHAPARSDLLCCDGYSRSQREYDSEDPGLL